MAKSVKVCLVNDLPPGKALAFEVEGIRVAVFNSDGTLRALEDTCTHAGGPLSEGAFDGQKVTCPWHAADFCLETGAALAPPAFEGVRSFKVRVEGDDVFVEV